MAQKEGKSLAQIHRCTKIIKGKNKDSEVRIEAYLDRANADLEMGIWGSAIIDYQAGTTFDEENPKNIESITEAWNCLGNLSQNKGNFEAAIYQYSQVIRIDWSFKDILFKRGLSYMRESENLSRKKENEEKQKKMKKKEKRNKLVDKK